MWARSWASGSGLSLGRLADDRIEAGEEFDRPQPRIDIGDRHRNDQFVDAGDTDEIGEVTLGGVRRTDDRILQRVLDIVFLALGPMLVHVFDRLGEIAARISPEIDELELR